MKKIFFFFVTLLIFTLSAKAQPTAYGFLQLSGKVNKQKAEISWITIQELNLDHFNIQRSVNGFDYETVAKPAALGTTVGPSKYKFTDQATAVNTTENVYYRLQCVDRNGAVSYSSVIRLQIRMHEPHITVMGSAAIRSELNLNISSVNEESTVILISDQQGVVVKQQPVSLFNGTFSQPIDVSSLSKGMYFITVKSGQDLMRERFIKQ